MEAKVTLFNDDGTQIGDTFARRARQLVKQQRAVWIDDNHTAIQFLPDPEIAEDFADDPAEARVPYPATAKHTAPDTDRDPLYAIAEVRLRDRKRVKFHLLMFIPAFIAILIFTSIIDMGFNSAGAALFFGFAFGALLTFNICNMHTYYNQHIKGRVHVSGAFAYWQTRHDKQLKNEVEKLRRMGYGD